MDDRQREAIEAGPGPVLVVAGPGAGKTFCLIGRIKFLIRERGFQPQRICAVTFTNRAAGEIAARLEEGGDADARLVTRGTLHALCLKVLRESPERVRLERGFGVADEDYQRALLRRMGVPLKRVGQVLGSFGRLRAGRPSAPAQDGALYEQYRQKLRHRNLVDFDDLLLLTHDLFQRDAAVLAAVAGRWDYLLVDEFQDLNPTQYGIVRQLVAGHHQIFAVGDDEQSIYSWAGADPTVLDRFRKDFGIAEPIVLDRNRRCSTAILEAARRALTLNPRLFDKELVADRISPFPVRVLGFDNDRAEVEWLVGDILAQRAEHDLPWGEFAVLYREHQVAPPIEQALLRAGVPIRTARGRALMDDDLVAEVLGALSCIMAPDDPVPVDALARRVLPRHLMNEVEAEFGGPDRSVLAALRMYYRLKRGSDEDRGVARRFLHFVENLPALVRTQPTLGGLVEALLLQRPTRSPSLLMQRADELTDPLEFPGARELAADLARVRESRGTIHLPEAGGLHLALRGLLRLAGFGDGLPDSVTGMGANDLDLRGPDYSTVTLFKALQLLSVRDVSDRLGDCVVFDLETTGRMAATCDIIELGACRVRGGKIVEEFQRLVRPSQPIPAEVSALHGITDDLVAGEPAFGAVWPAFRAFVGDDILVAHNGIDFDLPVLAREAAAAGFDATDLTVFDTLLLARSVVHGSHRLPDLAERFAVDPGTSHRALDDARALVGVLAGLDEARRSRQRRAALAPGLDWLGLALAIGPGSQPGADETALREIAKYYTLGRYGEALDRYEAAVAGGELTAPVDPEVVVARLGGERLRARLRRSRQPAQRYPVSVARLTALVDLVEDTDLHQGIRALLDMAALSRSDGAEVADTRVNLLTLHATKGLEFSRVYLIGVEDDSMPGWRALKSGSVDQFPEARRLLYVGMTRAKERLILTRVGLRRDRPTGATMLLDELGIPITAMSPAGVMA